MPNTRRRDLKRRDDVTSRSAQSRRRFVKAVTGGSLVAGLEGLGGRWIGAHAQQSSGLRFDEWPTFGGRLALDDATRSTYAQDYGQIVHERPGAVLQPGCVADIVEAVRLARRTGVRIAARGSGHQPYGQAQVQDGLVIDLRSLNRVHSIADDRIEVDAGATWRTVVQAAGHEGRSVPVLPAYLGLTVGGTLSIGGIGTATLRHGAQVDQVLELEVVTGTGAIVRCSEREHSDLFEAALAGQGHCAIITRATLRAVPAPVMIREYTLRFPDVARLLEAESVLLRDSQFDGVVGLVMPADDGWMFALLATRAFTPPSSPEDSTLTTSLHALGIQARDVAYASYVDERAEAPFGQPNAALGLLVAGSAAPQLLNDMLPRLRDDDLGAVQGMRVFTWNRNAFSRPLFRVPDHERTVYVAMLRADAPERAAIDRQLAGNRWLFETNRDRGGTLYGWSALDLDRRDWLRHYADAWRALAAAKQRYDPENVFASGPHVFR